MNSWHNIREHKILRLFYENLRLSAGTIFAVFFPKIVVVLNTNPNPNPMKNKLKFQLAFSLFLLFNTINFAQTPFWQWSNIGSGNGQDRAYCTTIDKSGNVYVAGQFSDSTITFGFMALTNSGHEDIFIVKFDPAGNYLWATSAGDTGIDIASGIACDTSGNVYVTGNFTSSQMVIGNSTLTNEGMNDLFIAKFDQNGAPLWAQSNGGTGIDFGNEIKSDGNGFIYLTGNFASPSITFGSTTLTAFGTSKSFTVKYDLNGNAVWAKGTDYTSYDQARSIAIDGNGNVFSAGTYYDYSVIIGSDTFPNQGNKDIYLSKYDQSGNFLWAISAGGFNADEVTCVATDAIGNVYITGHFYSPFISFESTVLNNAAFPGWDMYIAKYSSTGNLIWVHSATANTFDDACTGIAIDEWGNILVSGWFNGSFTLGTTTLQSEGGYDLFIANFDTSGNELWAKSAGGVDNDFAMTMTCGAGGIYTGGFFESPACNFDAITINDANSGFDMYLAKLIYPVSSVPESKIESDILFYPNPAHGHIEISSKLSENISVKLFSPMGQCVYQLGVNAGDIVDLKGLAKGIYICELKQQNILVNRKLVVY